MGTSTAPAPSSSNTQYSLKNPPPGAQFVFAEVKTDRGKTSLGQIPILEWGETEEDILNAIQFYGPKGISDILGGTSLRVSFQGIGRSRKEKAKDNPNDAQKQAEATDEAIAAEQLKFRPSSREGGQSTPASRLGNQAKRVAAKANPDVLAKLLAMVEAGTLDTALLAQAGIEDAADLYKVPASGGEENGETEESEEGQQ